MTLTGLVCNIFWAVVIVAIILILFEILDFRSSIDEILNTFNWYNKINNKTIQYCICLFPLLLTLVLFVVFVIIVGLLLQWGDTIILW